MVNVRPNIDPAARYSVTDFGTQQFSFIYLFIYSIL